MPTSSKTEISISVGNHETVTGNLTLPDRAKGIIVFSHGFGSSRLSSRNSMVADYLVQQQFGTLLFDVLITDEHNEHQNRNNIRLLAERLVIVSEWLMSFEKTNNLHQAYFGAGTGAAATLYAAAAEGTEIAAVVSCGGRPDLAMEVLPTLQSPTLFIVGGYDSEVLLLNQSALAAMYCPRRLDVIPDATHSFEEKGAMEKVCIFTFSWFEQYLHPLKMIAK